MRKEWTDEEVDYLLAKLGNARIPVIAENLDRTVASVELKLKRMGLYNIREQTGKIPMGTLARQLGVDRSTVRNWVVNHDLPCTMQRIKDKKMFSLIEAEDFWEWAEDNKEKINFSAIEKHSIPPEPHWVDSMRNIERKPNYRPWTTKEERIVQEELSKGSSYAEIGKKLNRSSTSVGTKYSRMKRQKQA